MTETVLKRSIPLLFHPSSYNFIVIGAGGNGGYYIPQLARMIRLANLRNRLASSRGEHIITIIEADKVEEKNLERQNFIANDVGKNKGEVMARRYGASHGVQINYIPEYIESSDHLLDIANKTSEGGRRVVFVGAVDNNKTRAIIHKAHLYIVGSFWIDQGNEEFAGQVVCGYNHPQKATREYEKEGIPAQFRLPNVVDLHPEILKATDKLPHEESCAERAVSNPQNIYTNMMASNIALGMTNILLSDNEFLKYHAIYFNSKTGAFSTRRNYYEELNVQKQKPVDVKYDPSLAIEKVEEEELLEVGE